jgi:hypothetical protein
MHPTLALGVAILLVISVLAIVAADRLGTKTTTESTSSTTLSESSTSLPTTASSTLTTVTTSGGSTYSTTVTTTYSTSTLSSSSATSTFSITSSSSATSTFSTSSSSSATSTLSTSSTSSSVTSTLSTTYGAPFVFAPPTLSGGDGPVTLLDMAPHACTANCSEWMEAKYVGTPGGQVWYIHADFAGATSSTSGTVLTVTTPTSATYPSGVLTYNSATGYMSFRVTSLPPNDQDWYQNVNVGDLIECYAISSKASWPSASSFYWDGNCKVNGGPLGVGHFIRFWSGGSGVNGQPLPSCSVSAMNLEGVFSIVTTGADVQINDFVCPTGPRYQVATVLWFDNGAFEDDGSSWGKGLVSETAQTKTCESIFVSIPTSRGNLSGTVKLSPYIGSGCSFQDATLSGSLTINGATYTILGVMSEWRCAQVGTYC